MNSLPLQGKEATKSGFTLVELIVVITILAILGTIAFISLQGYSATSRDSVRISDTGNMKTALELFHLNSGKYPLPDNYSTVSYSGSEVFYQGTFGETVQKNVSRNMGEIPTDPLTEQEYIYSVSSNKNELEILSLMEGDDFALNTIPQTNAAGITVIPRIIGNYNGLFVKTAIYIVPLPSIINTEALSGTLLILGTENVKSMITNKGKNVPKQGNVASATGALTNFTLTGALNNLTKDSSSAQKAAVINTIKSAYSGTILVNDGVIEYITNLAIDEITLASVFDTVVLNNTIVTTVPQEIPTNSCNEPDITVGGITIAACNVGTTIAATSYNDSNGYGHYFQFGRNISYENGAWTNGSSSYSYDWKSPGGTDAGSANDWGISELVKTTATYSNQNSSDQALMKGPCPTGYHIPTNKEWVDIIAAASVINQTTAYNTLKLPSTGIRNWNSGTFSDGGSYGYYWSSSPNDAYGYNLYFDSEDIGPSSGNGRSYGFSVRCFKN